MAKLVFFHCHSNLFYHCVRLIRNFQDRIVLYETGTLDWLFRYKTSMFFGMYILGFLLFVMSLRKGYLRYQIRQFFWTHCVLIFTAGMSLSMSIVFEGMIWAILSIICGELTFKYTLFYRRMIFFIFLNILKKPK